MACLKAGMKYNTYRDSSSSSSSDSCGETPN
jgi:hypothetical protein